MIDINEHVSDKIIVAVEGENIGLELSVIFIPMLLF